MPQLPFADRLVPLAVYAGLVCVQPTALPVGKSRPADLALAEDRPIRVRRSLLSRGSDEDPGVIQLHIREILPTG